MNPSRPVAAAAVRVLPPALLLVLVMAGLRGAVGPPRFNGPYKQYGVAIGAGLAVILIALLIATAIRHRRQQPSGGYEELDTAARLRVVLMTALGVGIGADVIAIFVGLHLRLFTLSRHPLRIPRSGQGSGVSRLRPHGGVYNVSAIIAEVLFYTLLAVVVIGAIVAIARFARMLQSPAPPATEGDIAEETQQTLRAAVEQARRALRTFDDTRAAIIACYAAMEDELALRGTSRTVADTPDELLARAIGAGLIRGPAARALTRLFYEARFSTHPMTQVQRAGAELCLDELATSLSEPARPARPARQASRP